MTAGVFDYLLVLVVILLSWQMLHTKDLFAGIVLYMVFGLLMALAWVRLHAPDIALVEAAIGSGLIGAFFLGVLSRLENKSAAIPQPAHQQPSSGGETGNKHLLPGLSFVLAVILTGAVLTLPLHSFGLGGRVEEAIPRSGVNNPVTAVILNFRAYDTLLEIGVLLLAALTVSALARFRLIKPRPNIPAERLLNAFVRILVPFMILIGGYFLWTGSDLPGGAFQAGAIFSGAGILLLLAGTSIQLNIQNFWLRAALAAGFLGFLLAGLAVMGDARYFLQYPPAAAKYLILLIEILAAVSIAVIFIYLFAVCAGLLKIESSSGEQGGRHS